MGTGLVDTAQERSVRRLIRLHLNPGAIMFGERVARGDSIRFRQKLSDLFCTEELWLHCVAVAVILIHLYIGKHSPDTSYILLKCLSITGSVDRHKCRSQPSGEGHHRECR